MLKNRLLSQLLHAWIPVPAECDCVISGLSLNTQTLQSGDLFFALIGSKVDGRDFIDKAIELGAKAILSESEQDAFKFTFKENIPIISFPHLSRYCSDIAGEFYNHPSRKMKVIGVTGTNGKTSSAFYIAAAFHALGKKTGLMGTIGCGIYGENLQDTGLTTADAITVQKTLAALYDTGVEVVGIEVSSHALAQDRVRAVYFTAAIFTNLTHDHLDYHSTMENYFSAKKVLFEQLSTEYVIINADDKYGQRLIESFTDKKKLCVYGIEINDSLSCLRGRVGVGESFVIATHPVFSAEGIGAELHTSWGNGVCILHQLGQFNLSNILSVICVMNLLGVSMEDILKIVTDLPGVPGRMQRIKIKNKPVVVIDFAHTPDALEKALLTLKAIEHDKIWCVFGCGGARDKAKRAVMGAVAEKFADNIIITDDNPRDEDPKSIVQDILSGMKVGDGKVFVQHDRRLAIEYAIAHAGVKDIILIAGKGHETYQVIGKAIIYYSDLETAEELLNND